MKAISFLLLAFLVSCNNHLASGQRGKATPNLTQPVTTEAPKHDHVPVPIPVPEEKIEENSNAHELVIEINQVNQILTITGNAGNVCGINFLVPHKMHYEVHSASQAQITLDGRVLDLERIDNSDQTKIFGDWSASISDEEFEGSIIFHIRLDPVLKLEASCEKVGA